jgi:hypothetical protein
LVKYVTPKIDKPEVGSVCEIPIFNVGEIKVDIGSSVSQTKGQNEANLLIAKVKIQKLNVQVDIGPKRES